MTDPRVWPANDRVIWSGMQADAGGRQIVDGTLLQICAPLVDLRREPDGPRDRQLRLGAEVLCLDQHQGWCFVRAQADGYVGYLDADALGTPRALTHRVAARATHLYTAPKVQAPETRALPFDARVQVLGITNSFAQTPDGFIPVQHLRALDDLFRDPVSVAELFLGTPYLWGGNSIWGLDCSGLVQQACQACGIPCPGDADQQQTQLGTALRADAELVRGDVLFWRGHVGMVHGPGQLIHANGTSMDVATEPLETAIARIAQTEYGDVIARRRIIQPRG